MIVIDTKDTGVRIAAVVFLLLLIIIGARIIIALGLVIDSKDKTIVDATNIGEISNFSTQYGLFVNSTKIETTKGSYYIKGEPMQGLNKGDFLTLTTFENNDIAICLQNGFCYRQK